MSEQKESSVLFSLKELMNLEEDRIRGEEDAKAARSRADEEARRAAEHAALQAEQARIAAEEERRRMEQQRSREEQAKLEAIRTAEIERAKVEAEQAARMNAMQQQQAHAIQMETIKTDKGKKQLRNILIGVVAAVLCIGSVVIYLVLDNNAKNEKDRIAAQQRVDQLEKEKKDLESAAAEAQANVANLKDAVAKETDEKKKAKLQADLLAAEAVAREKTEKVESAGGTVPVKPAGGPRPTATTEKQPTKTVCNCAKTDPLCDCL